MSKNIENTSIHKLPTSQLVFYMANPELGDEKLKSKIDATIYARLTGKYKLGPDMARRFINREKEIINSRGYDIESYAFGKDMVYDELFRFFYDNITSQLIKGYSFSKNRPYDVIFQLFDEYEHYQKAYEEYKLSDKSGIIPTLRSEDKFNTLTMSEIVEFGIWALCYQKRFKDRQEKLEKNLKSNESSQKHALNNTTISSDAKEKQINKLKEFREIIQFQINTEHPLINYNKMLYEFITCKLREVMGYDCDRYFVEYRGEYEKSLLRTIATCVKESRLLKQKSPIQRAEKERYKDPNFDAYAHYTAVPNNYLAQGSSKKV